MSEKYYSLGTHTAEQWAELHAELIADGNVYASVPTRQVTVEDEKAHSLTRGSYLLTDEEATALASDERVKFINIDYMKYPETYAPPPEELYATPPELINRYQTTVKAYREFESSNTLNPGHVNRTGYQIYRCMQKLDPWVENGYSDNFIPNVTVKQYGTGKDIDVIVADDGAGWMGHPEFQNNCTGATAPAGYTGGNLLPGNGTCDLLDLCLDAPYYIDPDYFNPSASSFTRVVNASPAQSGSYTLSSGQDRNGSNSGGSDYPITIYVGDTLTLSNTSPEGNHPLYIKTAQTSGTGDQAPNTTGQGAVNYGTVVFTPTEVGTYYYQCSSHVSMSGTITVELGDKIEQRWDGTIVPVESFARGWWMYAANRSVKYQSYGTVNFITSSYTRTNCNGSNSSQPPFTVARHATCCSALTFGRTQGWAYNANKWVLNLYGTYGSDIENGFDLQKLFHQMKPINPEYGNKNPTLSSNSWGYRATKSPGGDEASTLYHHFRGGAATAYTTETGISWLSHMGSQGDSGRWKGEMKINSLTTALDELIDGGVIFVCASGNSNQKQTNYGHADFDNYIAQNNTDTLEESSFVEFGVEVTGTTNRRGFPQQGGKHVLSDGTIDYKTINIGALDDDYNGGKETKVGYSDRGPGIDCYTPADGTLAANSKYTSEGTYPSTYPGFTFNSGSGAGVGEDTGFSGTSAACPVAAGLISTVLEHNRDWTYKEVKEWINSLDNQDTSDFYFGAESTTANDGNWTDYRSLEGSNPKVLYQGNIDARSKKGQRPVLAKGMQIRNPNIRIKKNK